MREEMPLDAQDQVDSYRIRLALRFLAFLARVGSLYLKILQLSIFLLRWNSSRKTVAGVDLFPRRVP